VLSSAPDEALQAAPAYVRRRLHRDRGSAESPPSCGHARSAATGSGAEAQTLTASFGPLCVARIRAGHAAGVRARGGARARARYARSQGRAPFRRARIGEVAALRPDVTPQIARMAASRLSDRPVPMRLCYEGTVLRRRQERAPQAPADSAGGVELLGVGGPDGDLELMGLAAGAAPCGGALGFLARRSDTRTLLDR